MDNSSSLFEKFKQQDSALLTSCGAELQELMHQVDVMVRRKKMEWEKQFNLVEDQLEIKEQEIMQAKTIINQKNKEICFLKGKIERFENENRNVNVQNERNVSHLKSELHKLKQAYANMQKHYHKKASSSEKEKRLVRELDSVKEQLNAKIETESKHLKRENDYEVEKKVMQHQIECLESQRKSFAQKCEKVQQQVGVYQSRLKRSNELIEEVEMSSQAMVKKIESELIKDKILIQRQEELIGELQEKCRQLDNARRITVEEKYKLQEEIDRLSCEIRTISDEAQEMKSNIHSKDAAINDNKHQAAELRNRISDLENMLHVKQQLIESLQLRSPKSREEELKRNLSHLQGLVESYKNSEASLREENMNMKTELECCKEKVSSLTKTLKNNEISKLSSVKHEIRNLRGKINDMEMSHTMDLCGLKADVTNLSSHLAKKDLNMNKLEQTCRIINHKLDEETAKRNVLANELSTTAENLTILCETNPTESTKENFKEALAAAQSELLALKQDYQNAVKTLEEENRKLGEEVIHVKNQVAGITEKKPGLSNGTTLHGQGSHSDYKLNKNESTIKQYLENPTPREEDNLSRKEFLKSIGVTSSAPSVNTSLYSDSGSKLTVNAIFGVNSVPDEDTLENEAAEKFMAEEEPKMQELENKIDSHIKNMQLSMEATIKKLMSS